MTKEELYEKLGGIYGGQQDLIDDVVKAFDNLEHINKMLQWSKDRLNKSDYELQQRIDKAIEYIDTKIKKSFNYDWGLDTSKPSDRLFTETIIELQLIRRILGGEDYE